MKCVAPLQNRRFAAAKSKAKENVAMKIKIIHRKVADLKCYENNPRNNEKAVKKVVESIDKFGFLVPIIIDKNNIIVAGETRLKAAKLLELVEVPCVIAENLNDEQIRAFRLIENKTSEFATWDFDKLREEMSAIDIDISAFEFPDLSDIKLDVSDEDFLQDTEIVKEKKNKIVTCPNCGEEFEI